MLETKTVLQRPIQVDLLNDILLDHGLQG